jgi:PHS family inorganic phosphate transporter-like MFS transporter
MAAKTGGGNAAFKNYHNDFAHITDPNERRRLALAEIDKAPFGWYHVKAVTVAGTGFFTDAYDIFAINMVISMLGIVFFPHGKITAKADTGIKVATSCGTVVGQLFFGWIADQLGRKKIYGFELMIIIGATIGQSLTSSSPGVHITGILIFWRIIMGIGIGGDYPLSSIITSEFATTKWRGAMMGSVFAMQGIGQLAAALAALIVTAAFKNQINDANTFAECTGGCSIAVDRMWRIVIGFGGVPASIALYYRLTIPETPRYTFDIARDVEQGEADATAYLNNQAAGVLDPTVTAAAAASANNALAVPKASWADFYSHYGQWKFGKILLGTAGSWFTLDVAFYGMSLNNSIILKQIGYSKSPRVYEALFNNAVGNIILICAGAIPGYWVTVFTCDRFGRKPIQLLGFTVLTVLFFVIGGLFHKLSSSALLGLYVVCQFFFNFGPNATTFIVPGECFPTRYRSTSHGISAAAGKVGAILAQLLIGPLRTIGATADNESPWLSNVMLIFGGFMALGIFTTILIPETARKTLEEIVLELYGEGLLQEELLAKQVAALPAPSTLPGHDDVGKPIKAQ